MHSRDAGFPCCDGFLAWNYRRRFGTSSLLWRAIVNNWGDCSTRLSRPFSIPVIRVTFYVQYIMSINMRALKIRWWRSICILSFQNLRDETEADSLRHWYVKAGNWIVTIFVEQWYCMMSSMALLRHWSFAHTHRSWTLACERAAISSKSCKTRLWFSMRCEGWVTGLVRTLLLMAYSSWWFETVSSKSKIFGRVGWLTNMFGMAYSHRPVYLEMVLFSRYPMPCLITICRDSNCSDVPAMCAYDRMVYQFFLSKSVHRCWNHSGNGWQWEIFILGNVFACVHVIYKSRSVSRECQHGFKLCLYICGGCK